MDRQQEKRAAVSVKGRQIRCKWGNFRTIENLQLLTIQVERDYHIACFRLEQKHF